MKDEKRLMYKDKEPEFEYWFASLLGISAGKNVKSEARDMNRKRFTG